MATSEQSKRGEDIPTSRPYLPKEIVTSILLNLAGSTLVRFRFVCKEWAAIISEPLFVKKHSERQIQDPNNARLLFSYSRCGTYPNQIILSVRCAETGSEVLSSEIPFVGDTSTPLALVGSCHGLVCMASPVSYRPLYLCNPITQQYRRLPDEYNNIIAMGFGFDALTDDHKLVKIVRCVHKEGKVVGMVSVYSVRSKCWRKVGAVHPELFLVSGCKSVSLNGRVHWVTRKKMRDVIVCFNLATEKFRVMKLPGELHGMHVLCLKVLKGCIGVAGKFGWGKPEIWVMNEYGVEESWSKLYEIKNREYAGGPPWSDGAVVVGLTGNGKVLIVACSLYNSYFLCRDIISYDSTSNKKDGYVERFVQSFEGVSYVECLTSI